MKKIVEIDTMRPMIKREDIIKEYVRYFNSDYVQVEGGFESDADKHVYTISYIWMNFVCRPPLSAYKIISMGISGVRPTKAGDMAEIYAFISAQGKKTIFSRISLNSTATGLLKEVQRGTLYDVMLGKYKDGSDYFADDRTELSNPRVPKNSYNDLLKKIGAKKITISQARKYPSSKGSDGYYIKTDWRIIDAMVIRSSIFQKKNNMEGGVYTISDTTTKPGMFVTSNGKIQNAGMTVWCAPELVLYDAQSFCRFIGTVEKDKENIPSMNAYNIIPIRARTSKETHKKAKGIIT